MDLEVISSDVCTPCDDVKDIIEELSEEKDFDYDITKISSDNGLEIANELGIKAVPTILLKDKSIVGPFVSNKTYHLKTGVPDKEKLGNVIDNCFIDENIEKCEEAMEEI